jgi:excisionase family DNA binding protein
MYSSRFLKGFGSRVVLVAVLCMALVLSGCSAFAVNRPPPEENWETLQCEAYCTSGYAAPIVDVGFAVVTLGSLGAVFVNEGLSLQGGEIAGVSMLGALGVAIAASAVHGFLSVDDCKEYLAFSLENPPLLQEGDRHRSVSRDLPRAALTLGEAASLTGLKKSTIQTWIDAGELPAVETVDGVRVSKRALEETWREKGGGALFE